jgi:hypothetical protein
VKVFAVPRLAAVERRSLRGRIGEFALHAMGRIAEISARLDEQRALRDRMNQGNETVDSAYWIYLR